RGRDWKSAAKALSASSHDGPEEAVSGAGTPGPTSICCADDPFPTAAVEPVITRGESAGAGEGGDRSTTDKSVMSLPAASGREEAARGSGKGFRRGTARPSEPRLNRLPAASLVSNRSTPRTQGRPLVPPLPA